jgi:hypothetical protein
MDTTNSTNFNIDDYSNKELLELLDLDDNEYITETDINESIIRILRSTPSYKNTAQFQGFMNDVKERLDAYIEQDESIDEKYDNEYNDEHKKRNKQNENTFDAANYIMNSYIEDIPKSDNLVNRKDGAIVDIGDKNNHYALLDKRLPVEQTYQVPILRGQLNPTLTNTHTRILHIDSQYRQDITMPSTNYTLDLNEPIYKVIKITLTAFEVPHSWYAFDNTYGTSAFLCNGVLITIPPGNYTPSELMTTLTTACSSQVPPIDLTFTYNNNTGKTTITNTNVSLDYSLTFYDSNSAVMSAHSELAGAKINSNLGILLGFKSYDASQSLKYTVLSNNGTNVNTITSIGIVDTYGPKYFMLGIDEFNNNKVNKNIIGMADNFTNVNMPSYYNCDICLNDPTLLKEVDSDTGLPKPSGLTTAQAYTITEVLNQQKNALDNKYNGTLSSNVFARIPVFTNGNFGTMISTTNNLKVNLRNYLGPIDITRLRVQLYNDKGQILNLNAGDFSLALQVEQLYQY